MKKKRFLIFLSSFLLVGCSKQANSSQESIDSSISTENRLPDSSSSLKTSADTSEEMEEEKGEEETDQHIAEIEQETGLHVVDNPESMHVYVNKKRKLPDGYEPPDLVVPDVLHRYDAGHMETHMREEAAHALEDLFGEAHEEGFDLMTISGYRSYDRQNTIYTNQVTTNGEEYANKYSARPGTSEHQTGLSMDVRYADDSKDSKLEQSFGDTETGKWLAQHASDYGFVIRYPKGKEEVTGYSYEPWHIRYVGKELSEELFKENLTLEEYFGYDEYINE